MLATRDARGEQVRASLGQVIRDANAACAARPPGSPAGCLWLDQVTFALEPSCVAVPLGWSLTETARREMRRQPVGGTSDAPCLGEKIPAWSRNVRSINYVLEILGAQDGMP
jgi:hypothetical protein